MFKFELSLQKEGKLVFTNSGSKIQTLAVVICGLGILTSIVYGLIACLRFSVLIGILVIVVGPVAAWLNMLFTYAFGEMVENINFIADLMKKAADEKYSQE